MLKKSFRYILLSFIFSIIYSTSVMALSCNYVAPYSDLSGAKEVKISCTLSNSKNECYIDVDGKNNKEEIINWKKDKNTGFKAYDYVVNNNKCPSQVVFVMGSGINGYKIYAAKDKENASNILTSKDKNGKKNYRIASSTSNISNTDIEKAYKNIEDYTKILNSFVNNFEIEDCIERDKTITRIGECKNSVKAKRMNKKTFENNVKGYVNTNVVNPNDSRVKAFYKAIEDFEKKLEKINKELEEEQKKIDMEMGLEPGSNITISEDETGLDTDIKYLSNICTESRNTVLVIRVIGYILLIAKILIPIALIIFGSIAFTQAIISGKQDDMKKSVNDLIWKFIAAIIIFFLPTIINIVIGLIDGATDGTDDYENCRECIFDPGKCEIPAEEGD